MDNYLTKAVILFDGYCNLCSGAVQVVIKADPKKRFFIGSLQSSAGKKLAELYGINPNELKTFILVEKNRAYTKSTAALRVSLKMKGLWPLFGIFFIVPNFIRDWVYELIATNRYRWFGRRESCWMPSDDLKDRFLPMA